MRWDAEVLFFQTAPAGDRSWLETRCGAPEDGEADNVGLRGSPAANRQVDGDVERFLAADHQSHLRWVTEREAVIRVPVVVPALVAARAAVLRLCWQRFCPACLLVAAAADKGDSSSEHANHQQPAENLERERTMRPHCGPWDSASGTLRSAHLA